MKILFTDLHQILLGQSRSEVCEIRDQRGRIGHQKGGIWDHRIMDHGIGISGCFERPGIRLYHFCGIRDQNQKSGYKNGISWRCHTVSK